MRTDSELIQVMIDNFYLFKERNCLGLCSLIGRLYDVCSFSNNEYYKAIDIVEEYMKYHNLSYKGGMFMYRPKLRWRRKIALKRMLKEALKREQV